jgi:hypothetical protein
VENNRGQDRGRSRTRLLGLNATDCSMRCYCRVINYGCMARYQLRVGLGLSLTPSRRFRKIKGPASAGFLFDNRSGAITLRRETITRSHIADPLFALRSHNLRGGREVTAKHRRHRLHRLSQIDPNDAGIARRNPASMSEARVVVTPSERRRVRRSAVRVHARMSDRVRLRSASVVR